MILANAKHEAVALAYLADPEKIGWRAYRRAYPKSSRHTAENCFSRLMKKEEFAARIAELGQKAAQGAVMTAQEVLEELSRLARTNMQDYMRPGLDGNPALHFSDLTRDRAAALQEVTVETFMDGGGEEAREVRKVKFKPADKLRALDLVGKHHALFTERHVHELGGVAERLAAALLRAEGEGNANARADRDVRRRGHLRKAARQEGAAGDARKQARWAR